jgi:hypothetical protein
MVVRHSGALARPALRRLLLAGLALVLGTSAMWVSGSFASKSTFPAATPEAKCGPGSKPETGIQGRVPTGDYLTGKAARGYWCNAKEVAHQGQTGGFKALRYTDRKGNTCAFYDSTLLFPKDILFNAVEGLGVVVLDMNRPSRPRKVANLRSPAMLSPHESLLVNKKRGLLAGVLGNAATNIGILDVYDIRRDCRHPRLLSSSTVGQFGHESGWTRDGRTFYSAGAAGLNLTAIDLTRPRSPRRIFNQRGVVYHGLRLSADGNTMYVANLGQNEGPAGLSGLRILDVSEIQARKRNPEVKIISELVWPERSLPQVAEPFTRNGRHYLLEVDEFANYYKGFGPGVPVGAARIIDIENPRRPKVVSNLRLQVHQPWARKTTQQLDPGAAIPVQGYAGHYCSVPTRRNPKLVACSMILSGLRVFDISRLGRPREAAYFNKPSVPLSNSLNPTALGAYAMSQPTWDIRRKSIWYTDGNKGFYVVRLTNGVQKLLPGR